MRVEINLARTSVSTILRKKLQNSAVSTNFISFDNLHEISKYVLTKYNYDVYVCTYIVPTLLLPCEPTKNVKF